MLIAANKRRHGCGRELHDRPRCSRSTSRSTSPRPTAPISTRTSTACGPRSMRPPSTRPAATASARAREPEPRPCRMGYEYFDAKARRQGAGCRGGVTTLYTQLLSTSIEGCRAMAGKPGASEKLSAKSVEPGKYDLVLSPGTPVPDHPRKQSATRRNWTACSATKPTTPAPASSALDKWEIEEIQVRLRARELRGGQAPRPGSLGA